MSMGQVRERHMPAARAASAWRSFTGGLATVLHAVAYALWLGGLIVLGAVVAPNVAHLIQIHAIAGDGALRRAVLAGTIGASFRALNYVVYACGALMLISDRFEALGQGREFRKWTLLRAGFTLFALALVALQGFDLLPAMDSAQSLGDMARFDRLHALYEDLALAQLPVLLCIPIMTAIRTGRSPRERIA